MRCAVTLDGEEPTTWATVTPVVAGPEEAGHVPVRLSIRERLDAGRHRLWLDAGGDRSDALVLSAPRRCPQPTGRWWGLFAPLYALRDDDDWGIGSFELDRARDWIERGGRLTATLPLFAQFLDEPMLEPSPYSPRAGCSGTRPTSTWSERRAWSGAPRPGTSSRTRRSASRWRGCARRT